MYLHPSQLARLVLEPGKYPVNEHSIEQTTCTLRRKLGESATTARLIVGQRCLGYALMIDEPTHVRQLALTRA